MGCHTWFKTKSKYSLEELRTIWLAQWDKWIDRWKLVTENLDDVLRDSMPQEFYDHRLKLYQRQSRMVRNKTIKTAFINHLSKTEEGDLYEYIDGVIYVDNDKLPHDVFRIGGYPDDILLSFQDAMRFCRKKDIKLSGIQLIELRKFWAENPIGMIKFG